MPPKSTLVKAVAYTLDHWAKLVRYLEDGNLQIDNRRVERAVKPFVIGPKLDSSRIPPTAPGQQRALQHHRDAKANGLVPYDYLLQILQAITEISDHIIPLLPWNVDLRRSAADLQLRFSGRLHKNIIPSWAMPFALMTSLFSFCNVTSVQLIA